MDRPPDDRSIIAKGLQWSYRIMTVSLEMVLPGLAGVWLDQQLGTLVVFTLIGFITGCVAAVWHLTRMTRTPTAHSTRGRRPIDGDPSDT